MEGFMKSRIKEYLSQSNKTWIYILIAFLIGVMIPWNSETSDSVTENNEHSKSQVWTCSMHPNVQLPEPGQCPICYMDLIPLTTSGEESDIDLTMTEAAMKIAEIQTTKIMTGKAIKEVTLSGKVEYDETQIKTISAWVPGRLEHLYVDYTGIVVKKGDHLVDIYSPDLINAQEELLQAIQIFQKNSDSEFSKLAIDGSRKKLKRMGLTDEQIQAIEDKGESTDNFTITSPIAGVVIHKNATVGNYVNTGAKIYTIANLNRVWITLDVYESDLGWVKFGNAVTFTVNALPGETFEGRVAFVDPVLDDMTRTARVRINVENTDMKLKPGMFAQATIQSQLDVHGHVINPWLEGKWVSPMHPEVVKDHPGQCDVCGMDLVRAEDLGITQSSSKENPILVPASSVLLTGKRALVYIKKPGTDKLVFQSREVELGPRVGDQYIVFDGLEEGEEVVTHGNFKIDSAMQIAAKPSMMNPEGGVSSTGHEGHGMQPTKKITNSSKPRTMTHQMKKLSVNEHFSRALNLVYDAYLISQTALANDNFKEAKSALFALQMVLTAATDKDFGLDDNSRKLWEEAQSELLKQTEHAQHWSSIDEIRESFKNVSLTISHMMESFELMGNEPLYTLFCPMAFDNEGASWVQKGKEVNNPYFGAKMLHCGSITQTFSPDMSEESDSHDH